MARYDPTKRGRSSSRPPTRRTIVLLTGAVPGSIMAAIIGTQTDRKYGNDPSGVATPISIPCMRWTVRNHGRRRAPMVAAIATLQRSN